MTNEISWFVELQIKPGKLEAFKELTRKMVEFTKTETGVLIYERFISIDEQNVYVLEHYADSAAAVSHLKSFRNNFGKEFSNMIERKQFYRRVLVVLSQLSPDSVSHTHTKQL
ncbi:hypothetical protein BH23BAC1_BH23BAC1_31580 [soil metagenome]